MDYEKLGFRAGLEIHQQLETHKLFCFCPSELTERFTSKFYRTLRPTQSEMGEIDEAALEESRRRKKFFYLVSASSCLVEADEEPPHSANEEAIRIALGIALLLKADIVDEIHFMRKIVVDGSNTTGFQRTALIALNGNLDGVGIDTICIEEDASRKIKEEGNKVFYSIDRLGIPLIEIATSPDIKSPSHAREIAEKIGFILRATKKVKRGIGTIRQDLNVSIKGGARVEIKGVQELNDIPKILKNEVKRQIEMIEVSKKLRKRIRTEDLKNLNIFDVSKIFERTESKFIKEGMKKGVILAVKLPGFAGIIGGIRYKEHRLGKEFSVMAKMEGGGIIHSDELPNYGISIKEIKKLKELLSCKEEDAFVISAGKRKIAMKCLKAVIKRGMQALKGVPEEVRKVVQDSFTEYMRPMPGKARMYPETDVPPIKIDKKMIEEIEKNLPELPDKKILRMCREYKISREEATQLVYTGKDEHFESLAVNYKGFEKVIARILLNIIPEIEKEGYEISFLYKKIDIIIDGLRKNLFAKEAIEKLLRYFAVNPDANLKKAIKECKLEILNEKDLRDIIKKIVSEKRELIKEKKKRALAPLMGLVMKELRGKADGFLISKILEEEIERMIK
ncbi:MAG TPA: Glu-tRNA(Gln) amidotransferase subunit GatE [Thermoplasmatales archaeon]|nr:Glu-tRNA(Gln) amidotransferase subunit GatE [Thermoplasmatales archaeon]